MTNGSDDFKMGERFAQIEGNVKVLREIAEHSKKMMEDFIGGIGKTVQDHDKGIVEIRTKLGTYKWVLYLLGGGVISVIVKIYF